MLSHGMRFFRSRAGNYWDCDESTPLVCGLASMWDASCHARSDVSAKPLIPPWYWLRRWGINHQSTITTHYLTIKRLLYQPHQLTTINQPFIHHVPGIRCAENSQLFSDVTECQQGQRSARLCAAAVPVKTGNLDVPMYLYTTWVYSIHNIHYTHDYIWLHLLFNVMPCYRFIQVPNNAFSLHTNVVVLQNVLVWNLCRQCR